MPGRASLKTLLSGTVLKRFAGAHNGMGARLAEQCGFDGVWISGMELATAAAVPDTGILTLTDYLDAARVIRRATALPVLADCDTGFGNAAHAMHAVREYEAAGIDGICIEDGVFPKVDGFAAEPVGEHLVVPAQEFARKVAAAKRAQRSREFVVVARTEALAAGLGCDEALRRARAYADAGADAVLVHSRSRTDREIREFLERWCSPVPVVLAPVTYPHPDEETLTTAGCRLLIYPTQGIRAAARAMEAAFREILDAGSAWGLEDRIAPMSRIIALQEAPAAEEATPRA